jgi:serine/threonine protein phosphatase PrpC
VETENQQREATAESDPASNGQTAPAASGGSEPNAQAGRNGSGDVPSGASGAPLAPGTRVGTYAVGRLLRDKPGERVYTATRASESDFGSDFGGEGDEQRFLLVELGGAEKQPEALEGIVMSLQHPRLLVPAERLTDDGRDYLVLAGLPASQQMPVLGSEGAYLAPVDALKAGAGLADALGYVHRNGLAHLHVSPEAIVIQDERAYLAGLEQAEGLGEGDRDPQALIAQDANALARALGALARLTATPPAHESPAQATLRDIVQRGEQEAFTMPDEVAAASGAALQTTPQPIPQAHGDTGERVRLHFAFATTVGRVRSENQDAAAAVVFDLFDDASGGYMPLGVFLVADGMGGEAHGELASRIAARTVPAELLQQYVVPFTTQAVDAAAGAEGEAQEFSLTALAQSLAQAVTAANRRIRDMAFHFRQDTGSTLTALATAGAQAIVAHLGDSRAYLLREDSLVQLTEDHTLLARLQAMDHPILNDPTFFVPRNFLYRSLGQEQAMPDLLDLLLSSGDRLLICSDGLWDELDDATIARELAAGADPASCARRLVELANEAGGHDNSTALVLFVHAAEPAAEPEARDTKDTKKLPAV